VTHSNRCIEMVELMQPPLSQGGCNSSVPLEQPFAGAPGIGKRLRFKQSAEIRYFDVGDAAPLQNERVASASMTVSEAPAAPAEVKFASLKVGSANVCTLHPHKAEAVGLNVNGRVALLEMQMEKHSYDIIGVQEGRIGKNNALIVPFTICISCLPMHLASMEFRCGYASLDSCCHPPLGRFHTGLLWLLVAIRLVSISMYVYQDMHQLRRHRLLKKQSSTMPCIAICVACWLCILRLS
jgi:hypothetical protein